ncbi:MAG TPA: hypothetical protein VFO34_06000 [Candidatus Acidoferrales bacterium]|nr:hypothetical protein [Candidatus Acidoferrales bacterium]
MYSEQGGVSIWFFIGALMFVYGILIFASGLFELLSNTPQTVVFGGLHAAVWWGALLIVFGGSASYRFFPRKS